MRFRDEGKCVTVRVPCKASEDDVVVTSTTVRLAASDAAGNTLLDCPQLFSTVDAAETSWAVEDGELSIRLSKLDPRTTWSSLSYPEASPPSEQTPAGASENALAAREALKQLFTAALEGSVAELQRLAPGISAEGLRGVKDAHGRTALHFAAQGGHTEALDYLIDSQGILVDTADDSGETALGLAAGANNLETVRLLLRRGAKPSLPASPNPQPLHRAAATGGEEVLKALLEAGAAIDAPSTAGTPLLWAAGSGNCRAVECLLGAGADANALTSDDVGAMLMAAASGNTDVVRALAASGANPNLPAEGGVTALHAAAEAGDLPTIRALVEAGANPDAEEAESGSKAIHAAASAGHREVVEHLLPLTQPPPGQDWTVDGLIADSSSGGEPAPSDGATEKGIQIPEAEDSDPEKAASSKRAGDEAFVSRDYSNAVAHYAESLRHDTRNAAVWANRSVANLRGGNAAEALTDAQKARVLDPTYTKAWYREGEAAKALQRYEDAAQAYFEAVSREPENRDLIRAFQDAIELAKEQHVQKQDRTE